MIQQNPYFKELGKRFSYFLLPKYFPNLKIVDSCSTTKEVNDRDMFSYFTLDALEKIRSSPNDHFFIFSQEDEGRDSDLSFKKIYKCLDYNIPPKKIIYLTGNQLDIENIKKWHKDINLPLEESINIVQIFWPHAPAHYHLSGFDASNKTNYCWETFSNHLIKYYRHNKLFLQASRIIRTHRAYANYRAYTSNIRNYFLISQDKFSAQMDGFWDASHYLNWMQLPIESEVVPNCEKVYDEDHTWTDMTLKDAYRFAHLNENVFPLTIDRKDFNTNWAMVQNDSLCEEFNFSTLFNIVMETRARSDSLFFSEKTTNALSLFQPFVIYGNPNINKHLKDIGFELYDEIFSYEFDSITNYVKRYDALLKMLKEVVKRFGNMTRTQQINFRLSLKDKLLYNYEKYMAYCLNDPHNPPVDDKFIIIHGPAKNYFFTTSPALDKQS